VLGYLLILASTTTPCTSEVCEPHGDAASGFAFGGAKPISVGLDDDVDGKPKGEDDALLHQETVTLIIWLDYQ